MQTPASPGAALAQPARGEELVPNLNNYVRGKLSRSEALSFADVARALAHALGGGEGATKEVVSKLLTRLALFGALPPSILPMLVTARTRADMPKSVDRKLLRVVSYLIQLAAGPGSAGTVVPFSTLGGQALAPSATDTFEYGALEPLWADAKSEAASHYQRAAAFRALGALARSSLESDPDDLSLVSALMAAVATTLDRAEAARRRRLPFGIGEGKKPREAERRAALERVAAQRVALSAARVGLPGFVLASKIAPRAFGGVNSPDATCARHALAVAALAARDMPGMFADQMRQLVANTLEIYRTTGSLGGAEQAAAIAAAASEGMPAPLRPTKELFQEKSLNLSDAWARLYLARGCGAVVHAGVGNAAPFWEMLVLLACCDKSTIVAMEAIKALAGAPFPVAATLSPSAASPAAAGGAAGGAGGRRPVQLPDEHAEADARVRFAMSWQLLAAHADDEAPGAAGAAAAAATAAAAAAAAAPKQFTISRTARSVEESASLRRLASLGAGGAAAAEGGDGGGAPATTTLFGAIVSRLLTCLGQMSHAAICSATRAVAVLAEARAHALAAARSAADRAAAMGDAELVDGMAALQERMAAIASDPGFSAHQREKAMEALLWFSALPAGSRGPPPPLAPRDIARWMSSGGGTVSAAVRAIFADPWPEDVVAAFMHTLARRLLSAPAAAAHLLACAAAAASAAPSRMRQEQLHGLWDVCLRANVPGIKLAGLQAALALMCAPTPPIAAPPSAAAPEVKALASREEAAMVALSRSAAWWLGENANFGCNEYAWTPSPPPPALVAALADADGASQAQLAAAAVAANPVLALLIARLQRVLVSGGWELRLAAAQALAKIAVRSGEPFRVQCYAILATAAGGSIAHRSRSASRGGPAARRRGGGSGGAAAAAAAAAAEGAAADPLGVAAVAGPALEVLDHMYAGVLVVEQLLARYGPRRGKWPKKLLRNLEARNAALLSAIGERVCFVPREHFWPLGAAAKQLITGPDEDEEERRRQKQAAADEAAAAAAAAAGAEPGAAEQPPRGEAAAAAEEPARRYAGSSDGGSPRGAADKQAALLERLPGYDYDPSAQPPEEEYPDDSVSQLDYADDYAAREPGAGSDDDSDVVVRRGTALYAFDAEEEDEVSISVGEVVSVEYEVGGWLQVAKADGERGLVPKTYVQVAEEEEESDALSLAGRSSVSGAQTQAEGAADYNAFLARSSMRLRTRVSTADSEASSSTFGAPRQRGARGARRSSADDGGVGGDVDAATAARMVALVAQQGGEVDTALAQVDALDAASRGGGAFNQPQYLHLRESLGAALTQLDALHLAGDARAMRRQMADRVLAGLDKLEALRRHAVGGGGASSAPAAAATPLAVPASPGAAAAAPTPRGPGGGGLGGGGPGSPDAASLAGGGGGEEGYRYQPTKVRVLYAFDAEAEGELSVAVGDGLWVEAEVDGWYTVVRDGDGARGLVPATYVDAGRGPADAWRPGRAAQRSTRRPAPCSLLARRLSGATMSAAPAAAQREVAACGAGDEPSSLWRDLPEPLVLHVLSFLPPALQAWAAKLVCKAARERFRGATVVSAACPELPLAAVQEAWQAMQDEPGRQSRLAKARAVCGDVAGLAWLRVTGCSMGVVYAVHDSVVWEAARAGQIAVLEWARGEGLDLRRVCEAAAVGGQLAVLRWARAQTPPLPWGSVCHNAAGRGDVEMLRWARAQAEPAPWGKLVCWAAAVNGQLEALRWLRANGCPWERGDCERAARNGHEAMVALSGGAMSAAPSAAQREAAARGTGDEPSPLPELPEPLVLHVLSFLSPALQAWAAKLVCKAARERFRGATVVSLRCPELPLATVQEAWRAVQGGSWQQQWLAKARAACGDVAGLAWLRGAGCDLGDFYHHYVGTMAHGVVWAAALAGHIAVLEWARGDGLDLSCVCFAAAVGGQLGVLRWARAQTPPLPWGDKVLGVCFIAAGRGDLEMLRWARAQAEPAPWGKGPCRQAAEGGHLETLRWLRAGGCPWRRVDSGAQRGVRGAGQQRRRAGAARGRGRAPPGRWTTRMRCRVLLRVPGRGLGAALPSALTAAAAAATQARPAPAAAARAAMEPLGSSRLLGGDHCLSTAMARAPSAAAARRVVAVAARSAAARGRACAAHSGGLRAAAHARGGGGRRVTAVAAVSTGGASPGAAGAAASAASGAGAAAPPAAVAALYAALNARDAAALAACLSAEGVGVAYENLAVAQAFAGADAVCAFYAASLAAVPDEATFELDAATGGGGGGGAAVVWRLVLPSSGAVVSRGLAFFTLDGRGLIRGVVECAEPAVKASASQLALVRPLVRGLGPVLPAVQGASRALQEGVDSLLQPLASLVPQPQLPPQRPQPAAAAGRSGAAPAVVAAAAAQPGPPPPGAQQQQGRPVDLSGLWVKDPARSDQEGYERQLDMLGLSGLQKVTARLIEGLEISQSATPPRRRRRPGGGVRVEMSWGAPLAGSLVESYALLPDGALRVAAETRVGSRSAASETVYVRSAASRDALLADSRARQGSLGDVLRRQRDAGLSVLSGGTMSAAPDGKRHAGPTTRARAAAASAAAPAAAQRKAAVAGAGKEAASSLLPELPEPLVLHILSFLPPALRAWAAKLVCKAARERFHSAKVVSLRCPELPLAAVQEAWRAVQGDAWWRQGLLANACAACGDVAGLAWLRGAGCNMDWVGLEAGRAGQVAVLEWARGEGLELWGVCGGAASWGQLAVLRWARAQTPPVHWDIGVCYFAAQRGDLEMLRWARAQDEPAPWDGRAGRAAAAHGQLEALRWLRANGCPWRRAWCERGAADNGHDAVAGRGPAGAWRLGRAAQRGARLSGCTMSAAPAGKRRAGPTMRARAAAAAAPAGEAPAGAEAAPSALLPELPEPLVLDVLSLWPTALRAWAAKLVCKAARERFGGAKVVSLRCPELPLAAVQEARRAVQGAGWQQQQLQRQLVTARAACGDVAGLAWLHGAGCSMGFVCWAEAAKHGQLAVLEWARGEGLDLWDVCPAAAQHGQLAVLEWARGAGLPLRDVCGGAASWGQLAVLRWARAQTPPVHWDIGVCYFAAQRGDLEMLRWARAQDEPAPWDGRAGRAAAAHGHLEALRWLRANGCPWRRAWSRRQQGPRHGLSGPPCTSSRPHRAPVPQPARPAPAAAARAAMEGEAAPLLAKRFQRGGAAGAEELVLQVEPDAPPPEALGTCRICLEQDDLRSPADPGNPLICPCLCSGSSRHVHRQCLQHWRDSAHRADACFECEVCKFRYQYRRLWWASLLGSPATLAVLFAVLMSGAVFLAGFVPITDALFTTSSDGGGSGGPGASPAPGPPPGSPAPGGGGRGGRGGGELLVPYGVVHVLNGVVTLGLLGLATSAALLAGRACGLPGAALLPDASCCPCCLLCLDGGGGGGAPLLGECLASAGAGGECCVALGALLAVLAIAGGVLLSAYMLYSLLWLAVQAGLARAQSMVENVHPAAPPAGPAAMAAGAAATTSGTVPRAGAKARPGGGPARQSSTARRTHVVASPRPLLPRPRRTAMAPAVSKETAITVGVVSGLAAAAAFTVYNREKAAELASAGYSSLSAQASAAASATSEGLKTVQAKAAAGYSTLVTSASATWESLAKKLGVSGRGLKRVKSFPIVPDEEDVAAAVDQTVKAAKKAGKKAKGAVKGVTESMLARTASGPVLRACRAPRAAASAQPASARMWARRAGAVAAEAPGLAPMPWSGTPEQQQALEQLTARMSAGGAECPDADTLRWYLRDRYFDVAEAEQKLRATLAWRTAFRAGHISAEDVAAEAATGKSVVHDSLDVYGRPVLLIRAKQHTIGAFPLDDSKRLCTYTLDAALARLPPGGEQLLGVIDLRGISLSNIDLPFVAFMVDAFFVYYPRRMGQVLLVDAPWIFKGPWELIKPLLRKYAALVRFVTRDELAADAVGRAAAAAASISRALANRPGEMAALAPPPPREPAAGPWAGLRARLSRSGSAGSPRAAAPAAAAAPPLHSDFAPPPPCAFEQPSEQEALRALQDELAGDPHGCPDEESLKWWLRDSALQPAPAARAVRAMLAWRAAHGLADLSHGDVAAEAASGKAYLHDAPDAAGRPVVVVRAARHTIGAFPLDDSKRLCTYMLDSALARLPPGGGGGAEQLLWVVDLSGISLANLDLAFVAFVLDTVPLYFPRRVGAVLFVDAPWIFKGPWEAFKPLLRKYAALVRFVTRDELAAEFFTPQTLPRDFNARLSGATMSAAPAGKRRAGPTTSALAAAAAVGGDAPAGAEVAPSSVWRDLPEPLVLHALSLLPPALQAWAAKLVCKAARERFRGATVVSLCCPELPLAAVQEARRAVQGDGERQDQLARARAACRDVAGLAWLHGAGCIMAQLVLLLWCDLGSTRRAGE
ncbi:SPAC3H8.02 [Scenedesmus sp. PABB004]|nr:SPAC3H8.02 [Scenedesmus sp. PABB004]